MNAELICICLIPCSRGFYNGIENRLLAREMVVKRRRLDADRRGDLPHADGIVAAGRKKFQRRGKNFLFGIFLFHYATHLTNVR